MGFLGIDLKDITKEEAEALVTVKRGCG